MKQNKIFTAILYSSDEVLYKSIEELIKLIGNVDFETQEYDFGKFTNYYEKEMGKDLKKKFIFFRELSDIHMADLKKLTIQLEKKFSIDGKRQVNIDPGYINEKEMGMPTTKYLKFKTLLKEGIYNQIIYRFEGEIKEAEGAFPDFRDEKTKDIFAKVFISLKNNPPR